MVVVAVVDVVVVVVMNLRKEAGEPSSPERLDTGANIGHHPFRRQSCTIG